MCACLSAANFNHGFCPSASFYSPPTIPPPASKRSLPTHAARAKSSRIDPCQFLSQALQTSSNLQIRPTRPEGLRTSPAFLNLLKQSPFITLHERIASSHNPVHFFFLKAQNAKRLVTLTFWYNFRHQHNSFCLGGGYTCWSVRIEMKAMYRIFLCFCFMGIFFLFFFLFVFYMLLQVVKFKIKIKERIALMKRKVYILHVYPVDLQFWDE